MKILVLMPLQEQYSYLATGIYKNLTGYAKEHCFIMPQFMEYLMATKISQNYTYAFFDSIVSAEGVYKTAELNNDDLIIIGNLPKDYKFDVVFNFQDENLDLPYADAFVDKLKEICASEECLMKKLDLHTTDESKFTLHNCAAAANFISKYLDSEPKLDNIEKEYQEDLMKLKEKYGKDFESKRSEA